MDFGKEFELHSLVVVVDLNFEHEHIGVVVVEIDLVKQLELLLIVHYQYLNYLNYYYFRYYSIVVDWNVECDIAVLLIEFLVVVIEFEVDNVECFVHYPRLYFHVVVVAQELVQQ